MAWKNGSKRRRTTSGNGASNQPISGDESGIQGGSGISANPDADSAGHAAVNIDPEPIANFGEPEIIEPDAAEPADDSRNSNSASGRGNNSRKRTSASGRTNTRANYSQKKTVFVEKTLYSIHLMLAHVTKIEELAIPKDEAAALAEAIDAVGKEFKISVSPKMDAITNLGIVMAGIYGPRVFSVLTKDKGSKQNPNGIHEVK